ncbi:hypothetical protein AURDEDRAFT_166810 [Auricularia subglabra TFB-10046 SS5]|nr:hypothetical protein AURDEDRAFT_166810 [Auricularia subglabra TFB-10046 SS5]
MPRHKPAHLPAELLLLIFEDVRLASQDKEPELAWRCFYRDLCRFALVHRTWTAWAQEVLFAHVAPHGGSRLPGTSSRLDALLRAPRHLRLKTRSMSLQLGSYLRQNQPRSTTSVLARHASWDQFTEILRAFLGIHTLQLGLHSLDVLQMAMDDEQLATVRQYNALRRFTLWPYVAPPEEAVNQLVNTWPLLETLELAGGLERLFHFPLEPLPSHPLVNLRELKLCLEIGEDGQEWLRNTFAGLPQLRTLRCSIADLPTFLSLLHGTLESLTVDFTSLLEHGPAFAGLARCNRLHTLILTGDTLAEHSLNSFPPNLQHLSLIMDPLALLRSNLNWSSLQTVTVAYPLGMQVRDADEQLPEEQRKLLQEKFLRYGIEFTLLLEVPTTWVS